MGQLADDLKFLRSRVPEVKTQLRTAAPWSDVLAQMRRGPSHYEWEEEDIRRARGPIERVLLPGPSITRPGELRPGVPLPGKGQLADDLDFLRSRVPAPAEQRPTTAATVTPEPIGIGESIVRGDVRKKLPFSPFAAMELAEIKAAADRMNTGAYSSSRRRKQDELLLTDFVKRVQEEEARGTTIPAKVGSVVSSLPAFIYEMAATSGVAGLAGPRAASGVALKGALQAIGKRGARKAGLTMAAKGAAQWAGRAALRTPFMAHRVAQDYARYRLPELDLDDQGQVVLGDYTQTPLSAAAKAILNTYIEVLSEEAGEALGVAGRELLGRPASRWLAKRSNRSLVKRLAKELAKHWSQVTGNPKAQMIKQALKTGGWDGMLGEIGEERVGDALRAVLGVEDFGTGAKGYSPNAVVRRLIGSIPDSEQLLTELISFSVIPAGQMGFAGSINLLREKPPKPPSTRQKLKDIRTQLKGRMDRFGRAGIEASQDLLTDEVVDAQEPPLTADEQRRVRDIRADDASRRLQEQTDLATAESADIAAELPDTALSEPFRPFDWVDEFNLVVEPGEDVWRIRDLDTNRVLTSGATRAVAEKHGRELLKDKGRRGIRKMLGRERKRRKPVPAEAPDLVALSPEQEAIVTEEAENLDHAIQLAQDEGEFQGVSLADLQEAQALLQEDPAAYFVTEHARHAKAAIDAQLQGADDAAAMHQQVAGEYERLQDLFVPQTRTPAQPDRLDDLDQVANDLFNLAFAELDASQQENVRDELQARRELPAEESERIQRAAKEEKLRKGLKKISQDRGKGRKRAAKPREATRETPGEAKTEAEPARPRETAVPEPAEKAEAPVEREARKRKGKAESPETLRPFMEFFRKLAAGHADVDELRNMWAQWQEQRDQVEAAFKKMTKVQISRYGSGWVAAEWKRTKKDRLISNALNAMERRFWPSDTMQYSPMEETHSEAIARLVAIVTQEQLDEYARKVGSEVEARQQRRDDLERALEDPRTLDDFQQVARIKGEDALTDDQLARYDELRAAQRRERGSEAVPQPAAVDLVRLQNMAIEIVDAFHDKKNLPMHVVQLGERVSKDLFTKLRALAKRHGGYYSGYDKGRAKPGFQFESREDAEGFREALRGQMSEGPTAAGDRRRKQRAEKLRKASSAMTARAQESLAQERQVNTAKRAAQAASAEIAARAQLQRAETLDNLAEAMANDELRELRQLSDATQQDQLEAMLRRARHLAARKAEQQAKDAGEHYIDAQQVYQTIVSAPFSPDQVRSVEWPAYALRRDDMSRLIELFRNTRNAKSLAKRLQSRLKKLKTEAEQYEFASGKDQELAEKIIAKLREIGEKYQGHYLVEAAQERKRLARMDITSLPELRAALREYLEHRGEKQEEDELRKRERALVGKSFDGFDYFPTPKVLADRIVEEAGIDSGMRVLEPSAGKGDLADAVKEGAPGAAIEVVEPVQELRDLLESKGYELVSRDFLEFTPESAYDRVVMNPPFSKGRDVQHVQHAYELLKPGGKLVAIMSEHPFFADDKASKAFREWLDDVGGTSEKLEGAFGGRDAVRKTNVASRLVIVEKTEEAAPQATPVSEQEEPAPAESWQMTRAEYVGDATDPDVKSAREIGHAQQVKRAVQEGKPVPARVLKNYGGGWAKTALAKLEGAAPEAPAAEPEAPAAEPEAPAATPATVTQQETPKRLVTISGKEDLGQLALEAHRLSSFVPEKRAEQRYKDYEAHFYKLQDDLMRLTSESRHEELREELLRFRSNLRSHYRDWLSSEARVASTMITGRSGFNVRQHEKRVNAAQNKYEKFTAWKQKATKAIYKKMGLTGGGAISSDEADAVEQLQKKLDRRERLQELMKAANKVIRNKKLSRDQKIEQLAAMEGMDQEKAAQLLNPDDGGRVGFAAYELNNNNANIRRIRTRIAELEQAKGDATSVEPFAGGILVDNTEANRVQLFFDAKPDTEVRQLLKSHGFKWSPSAAYEHDDELYSGAWQRKRGGGTTGAMFWARQAAGIGDEQTAAEPEAPATVTEKQEERPAHEDTLAEYERRFVMRKDEYGGLPWHAYTTEDTEFLEPLVFLRSAELQEHPSPGVPPIADKARNFKRKTDLVQAMRATHRIAVQQAVKAGKDLREEVLADYPDLATTEDLTPAQLAGYSAQTRKRTTDAVRQQGNLYGAGKKILAEGTRGGELMTRAEQLAKLSDDDGVRESATKIWNDVNRGRMDHADAERQLERMEQDLQAHAGETSQAPENAATAQLQKIVNAYQRTTPEEGTPEREEIQLADARLEKDADDLATQLNEAKEELQRTPSRHHRKREKLRKKVAQLDAQYHSAYQTWQESDWREKYVQAAREDRLTGGDLSLAATAAKQLGLMFEDDKNALYEYLHELALEEAEKQDVAPADREIVATAAANMIENYPSRSIADQVGLEWRQKNGARLKAAAREEIQAAEEGLGYQPLFSRTRNSLKNASNWQEDIENVMSEFREELAALSKLDAEQKRKDDESRKAAAAAQEAQLKEVRGIVETEALETTKPPKKSERWDEPSPAAAFDVHPLPAKVTRPVRNDQDEERKIKALATHVSTDQTRYIMTGVYYDAENKALVATDGRRLAHLRHEGSGESRIIPVKKGVDEIEGTYPNWQQVVPKPTLRTLITDVQTLYEKAAGAKKAGRFFVDPSDNMASLVAVHLKLGEHVIAVDGQYLYEALELLQRAGAEKIELKYDPPTQQDAPYVHKPWLFSDADNADSFVVLMPRRGTDTMKSGAYTEFELPAEGQYRERLAEGVRRASPAERAKARALLKRIFGDERFDIVDRLFAEEDGREVAGKYQNDWITLAEGGGDLTRTAPHESWHRIEDTFMTAEQRALAERVEPDSEKRAEMFRTHSEKGALRRLFGKVRRWIRRLFGAERDIDKLRELYDRVLGGEFAGRRRERARMPATVTGKGQLELFPQYADQQDLGKEFRHVELVPEGVPELLRPGRSMEANMKLAAGVFSAFPESMTAADGREILLQNPEDGSIARRVKHLIWHEALKRVHTQKLAWLPNVPKTLQEAEVRLHDANTGRKLYAKMYETGDVHLVVVDGKSRLSEQRAMDGALWTQFLYGGPGNRQKYMLVEWVREDGGGGSDASDPTTAPFSDQAPAARSDHGSPSGVGAQGPAISPADQAPGRDATPDGTFAGVDSGSDRAASDRLAPTDSDGAGPSSVASPQHNRDQRAKQAEAEEKPQYREQAEEDFRGIWEQTRDFVLTQLRRSPWMAAYLDSGKIPDKNARPELSQLAVLFGTPAFNADKVEAFGRMFDAALERADDKHWFEEAIFQKDLEAFNAFRKADKEDYARLAVYIVDRDRDAAGYFVEPAGEDLWNIHRPDGSIAAAAADEGSAWAEAYRLEAGDLVKEGFSEAAAAALISFRQMNARQYELLKAESDQARAIHQKYGLAAPVVPMLDDAGELVEVDIFDYINELGDRRGYYMPRLRKSGQWILTAYKGNEKILRPFVTRAGRRAVATWYKKHGYKVEFHRSEKPSEEAFLDLNISALNDMLRNALTQMERQNQQIAKLEDFGYRGELIDYRLKDGGTEKHFVIDGKENPAYNEIFKMFGGNRYAKQRGDVQEVWHFVEPAADLEKDLAQTLYQRRYSEILPAQLFGSVLANQVAAIIHSRGSRARKIARREETGEDVYKGYEEDPAIAVTRAGKSLAGGTAKRIMAKRMMQAMTGTDISWDDWKKAHIPEDLKQGSQEWREAQKAAWASYQAEVDRRRIDSATQPNTFKEAASYMREMMRNDEPSEQFIGILRGLTAVKYLSRPSSALINMTALATTVPASMGHYAKINLRSAPKLLSRGAREYVQYMSHAKWGKGPGLEGEAQWLFDEITRRGWDADLMHREAMDVLQGHLGRAWSRTTEALMITFAVTERVNRASTIAGTYYGLKAKHTGEWTEADRNEALEKAKLVSDKAHAVYGKANLPQLARGSTLGAQVLRSAYMFKTFSHNYVQLLYQMGWKDKDIKNAAFLWLSPMVIGGGGALAGAGLISAVVKVIWSAIPGAEPPDDPEEALYAWAGSTFGPAGERFARTGVAGMLGMNLKGSLRIGIGDIPTSMNDLLGAPASMVQDVWYGAKDIYEGRVLRGAERLGPGITGGPLRAIRESTEGVTTRSGQPVYYGDRQLRLNTYDAMLRFAGFNPARVSEKREQQWAERQVKKDYDERRSAIYRRLRQYFLQPPRKRTTADWLELLMDMEAYNARVRRRKPTGVNLITKAVVLAQIRKLRSVPKAERIRAGTEEPETDTRLEKLRRPPRVR